MMSLLLLHEALAHKPTFGPGYGSPESAYLVEDPTVSIVVYSEITCQEPQLWMNVDAEPGFPVYLQLGVPELPRLKDWRPSIALLAPGLPAPTEKLPFDVPEGMGITMFPTTAVEEPGMFFEPFSGTSSWVLVEETVILPEGGPALVVAWDPGGYTGKLWMATGTIEDFANVDPSNFVLWMEQVNNFHETGRYEDPPDTVEVDCAAAPAPAADEEATGCAHTPASGLAGLVGLGALLGRRSRGRPTEGHRPV
jgi:hypothetical protein